MNLLNNLTIIYQSPLLLASFFVCATVGLASFFAAVKFCQETSGWLKFLKYVLALISVAFTSNFFVLVSMPEEFAAAVGSLMVLHSSLLFVAIWIAACEVYILYKASKKPLTSLVKSFFDTSKI